MRKIVCWGILFFSFFVPWNLVFSQQLPEKSDLIWAELAQQADNLSFDIQKSLSDNNKNIQIPALRKQIAIDQASGDIQSVIKNLKLILTLPKQNTSENWVNLGKALKQTGSMDFIAADYQAYKIEPSAQGQVKILNEIAAWYEENNQPSYALIIYRKSQEIFSNNTAQGKIEFFENNMKFSIQSSSLNDEGDQRLLCITFTEKLPTNSNQFWMDYIKIEPKIDPLISVKDENLCVSGFNYEQKYTVNILAGIPSILGNKLNKNEQIIVNQASRTPSLGFQGSSYVLPKIGTQGIPLISVNYNQASLKLLRINDRNMISQALQKDGDFFYSFLASLDSYSQERIANNYGEKIWQGTVDIKNVPNQKIITSIPITAIIKDIKPGVYVLTAAPVKKYDDHGYQVYATQWVIISDLGLTSFWGQDGITVNIRSLATTKPIQGAKITLYAKNNEELISKVSDADGLVHFDQGFARGSAGKTPLAVMANLNDDFSFLDLAKPAFDLSDRGVGGRVSPNAYDLYFYTDRGVYRPGETVHLVGLLRDKQSKAVEKLPLTLKTYRPDGTEVNKFILNNQGSGGYIYDLNISETARTGQWKIIAYADPNDKPIGEITYLVEEVVPARIEVKLSSDAKRILPAQENNLNIQANYLYGAPAQKLLIKSELNILQNPEPFPGYKDYHFGLVEEDFVPTRQVYDDAYTDDKGQFILPIKAINVETLTQPLLAKINVSVFEPSGRPVIENAELPIQSQNTMFGIKPLFENSTVSENSEAAFSIIAVDSEGKIQDYPKLSWRLIEENWDYQWYYNAGSNFWDYKLIVRDKVIKQGDLALSKDQPGKIGEKLAFGHYRFEVSDLETGVASSIRFTSGFSVLPTAGDTPDTLKIVSDKETYKPGDMAHIIIHSPFDGEALLMVATDRILFKKNIKITNNQDVPFDLKVDESWGAGAYFIVTAFRPDSGNNIYGPNRAIGLNWLGIDQTIHKFDITMDVPEYTAPRQSFNVPIQINNFQGQDKIYLTLAAVDEGILTLTDYKGPDPLTYFFGKRQLGVNIRDLYSQLIKGKLGERGLLKEGGDSVTRRGTPSEIKLVSLFSGLVNVSSDGKVNVPLNIPDYNGKLRLMAVAYSKDKVGSLEKNLIVRDPLVVEAHLPRFLALADTSTATIILNNLEAPEGDYELELGTKNNLITLKQNQGKIHLKPQQNQLYKVGIIGKDIGVDTLTMRLKGPNNFVLEKEASITIRSSQFPVVKNSLKKILGQENLKIETEALSKYINSSVKIDLNISSGLDFDFVKIIKDLDLYPYSGSEQIISRSIPLISLVKLKKDQVFQQELGYNVKEQIQKSINLIFEKQRWDGSFGQWNAYDKTDPWLTSYAMDFLIEAQRAGFTISESNFKKGLEWLDQYIKAYDDMKSYALGSKAYAIYILAKANAGNISDARYMFDNYIDLMPTGLATAQIGAALAFYGDQSRSTNAFKKAVTRIKRRDAMTNDYYNYYDYGSVIRDQALLIYLLLESKNSEINTGDLIQELYGMLLSSNTYDNLSTQEKAWISLVAQLTYKEVENFDLSIDGIDGKKTGKNIKFQFDKNTMPKNGLNIHNLNDFPLWVNYTFSALPIAVLPAEEKGLVVKKQLYSFDGKKIDPLKIKQGDMFVVLIEGKMQSPGQQDILLTDLLPAGLEIENARLANSRLIEELRWLPQLTNLTYSEFLDDRYRAVFNLNSNEKQGQFTVAYIVRAVTSGSYILPASVVEAAYAPSIRGRGIQSSLTISDR
ncbi:MAG: alpha-2-macroglobulin family protein [Alphaproteobacteria bacterium]|nr:alpha-2-macroglobulin family protein [Alphaproteobacteria bacterium]